MGPARLLRAYSGFSDSLTVSNRRHKTRISTRTAIPTRARPGIRPPTRGRCERWARIAQTGSGRRCSGRCTDANARRPHDTVSALQNSMPSALRMSDGVAFGTTHDLAPSRTCWGTLLGERCGTVPTSRPTPRRRVRETYRDFRSPSSTWVLPRASGTRPSPTPHESGKQAATPNFTCGRVDSMDTSFTNRAQRSRRAPPYRGAKTGCVVCSPSQSTDRNVALSFGQTVHPLPSLVSARRHRARDRIQAASIGSYLHTGILEKIKYLIVGIASLAEAKSTVTSARNGDELV
jgi:hypothetical protein